MAVEAVLSLTPVTVDACEPKSGGLERREKMSAKTAILSSPLSPSAPHAHSLCMPPGFGASDLFCSQPLSGGSLSLPLCVSFEPSHLKTLHEPTFYFQSTATLFSTLLVSGSHLRWASISPGSGLWQLPGLGKTMGTPSPTDSPSSDMLKLQGQGGLGFLGLPHKREE